MVRRKKSIKKVKAKRPKNANKKFAQVGKSKKSYDEKRKAKRPGYRLSKNGNWYFENRRNRSDADRRKKL